MKLISVNVSAVTETIYEDNTVKTGIFKEPVTGRILLSRLNLVGDQQADPKHHGGPDKAVYAYTTENYAHWQRELERDDLRHAQFGENFTVEGMPDDQVCVGNVYRVGSARVQVTQPRVPCFKLGIRMGDPGFVKSFLRSCRVGFYLRVLDEGEVGAGDEIELLEADAEKMTVRDVLHLYFFDPQDLDACKRASRIKALSSGWRDEFEERLAGAKG